jgi:hypothetical protein
MVVPSPATAMSGRGGGGGPRFNISVRGDSAGAIMKTLTEEVSAALSDIMTPTGSNARFYDLATSR